MTNTGGHTALPECFHVLFVDDSADERDLFGVRLAPHGAKVTAVASGEEALFVLEEKTPDVVVTDITLGGMSGYELVARMRALPPEVGAAVPAIAVTGFTGNEEAQRLEKAGFAAHLFKPYETAGLVGALEKVAAQIASLRELRARCARQRVEQRELRRRLAERRGELEEQRMRLSANYGRAEGRDGVLAELALAASRDLGATWLGAPVEDAEIVSSLHDGKDGGGRWLVLVTGGGELTFVDATVDAEGRATVTRFEN